LGGVAVVSVAVVVSAAAILVRSLAAVLVLASACLSSFASAVVVSVERGEAELFGELDVVALPLSYVGADELLAIVAFVPGAELDEVIGEDVLAEESAGRPLSLEVEVVLGVVIVELEVSGAFWSFLKWPIASALPAASARMELVRNIGASLRMMGSPGFELIRKMDKVLTPSARGPLPSDGPKWPSAICASARISCDARVKECRRGIATAS
jgi:hypothetical protein